MKYFNHLFGYRKWLFLLSNVVVILWENMGCFYTVLHPIERVNGVVVREKERKWAEIGVVENGVSLWQYREKWMK